jgi:flagellar P-ring protein precursor FlgI
MAVIVPARFAPVVALVALALLAAGRNGLAQAARIRDLTARPGDIPRRLVGYGLVVGLEGTGDRSWGGANGGTMTVHAVVNLLRRFDISVPPDQLRLRNVGAVLVTAEVSPYLRAGGRFDVQVAALGDASSLRGGVLWMTPLVSDVGQDPVGTAQGPLLVTQGLSGRSVYRGGNAGRIPDGGVLEVDGAPGPVVAGDQRLLLKHPDLALARHIADAIARAYGNGAARVEDAGAVRLKAPGPGADTVVGFLAAVETLTVQVAAVPRVVIDAREGTVVAGGDVRVGPAVVSHHGYTVAIGGTAKADTTVAGLLQANDGSSVQDIAAGLHRLGARPEEIAAIFDALDQVGAITAAVLIR